MRKGTDPVAIRDRLRERAPGRLPLLRMGPQEERAHQTTTKHDLTLESTGRTASLRSVVIKCSCGVRPASLEGAFGGGAMSELGIKCKGRRPWLGRDAQEPGCTAVPRTLQRGASAAWFSITRSALSIPPWSETLQQRLNPHYELMGVLLDSDMPDSVILNASRRPTSWMTVASQRRKSSRPFAGVENWRRAPFPTPTRHSCSSRPTSFGARSTTSSTTAPAVSTATRTSNAYRPPVDGSALPYGIKRSMLVKRLREVRALESFTRVTMPDPAGGDTRRAAMARGTWTGCPRSRSAVRASFSPSTSSSCGSGSSATGRWSALSRSGATTPRTCASMRSEPRARSLSVTSHPR